jgi:hypothetical protein
MFTLLYRKSTFDSTDLNRAHLCAHLATGINAKTVPDVSWKERDWCSASVNLVKELLALEPLEAPITVIWSFFASITESPFQAESPCCRGHCSDISVT